MSEKLRVFKISCDVNRYQMVVFSDDDLLDFDEHPEVNIDGTPKEDRWEPVELYIPEPKLKKPDFYNYFHGSFVLGERAAELCELPLLTAGELLPVNVEDADQRLQLFNPTACLNCLDRKKSVLYVDERADSDRGKGELLAFHPNRFSQYTIFMTPHTGADLFAIEGTGDPDEEFKVLVERHQLKGLTFDLVWEEGREPFWSIT